MALAGLSSWRVLRLLFSLRPELVEEMEVLEFGVDSPMDSSLPNLKTLPEPYD